MDWDTIELLNDKNAEIDGLKKQNARLQYELDKYIKMASDYEKALKDYADRHNWSDCWGECDGLVWETGDNKGWETAQETLKKWENK